jgi:hypothetical protein
MKTQKVTFKNNELPAIINKETSAVTIFNKEGVEIITIPNIDPNIRKEYIKKLLSNYNLSPTIIIEKK